MYAGKVSAVKIPEGVKVGRIYVLKNGYVYYATDSHWDKEKQHTVEKRISIGKQDSKRPNMMYPNKNFEKFFGIIDDKVNKLRELYDRKELQIAGKRHFSMSYGGYVVLAESASKCGLLNALERSMGENYQRILALSIHSIINKSSTAQLFPYWSFDNYCGYDIPSSDSDISLLFKHIGDDQGSINIFFELFKENFHKIFPGSNERVCAYDSTNQGSKSKNQSKVQYGKSKKGKIEPIINTALFTDEETGISLWYEHYDGNILDSSQCTHSLEKAQQLGYEKLFLMMDRGFYSYNNAKKINRLNIGFGFMIPESVEVVTNLIKQYNNVIKLNEKYYIYGEDIYGICTPIELKKENGESSLYQAYVFYDHNTFNEELKSIHEKTAYYLKCANERKNYTKKLESKMKKVGIIVEKVPRKNKKEKNFTVEIDRDQVDKAIFESGFFVIISNRLMSVKQMIRIARGRDSVEKSYMYLKSHFDLNTSGVHSDSTYNGKMFTAFVALVLLQSFRWYTKKLLEVKTSENTSTLIAEMQKYKIQRNKDDIWIPSYAMNKKQKDILQCLSITEDDVLNKINDIS